MSNPALPRLGMLLGGGGWGFGGGESVGLCRGRGSGRSAGGGGSFRGGGGDHGRGGSVGRTRVFSPPGGRKWGGNDLARPRPLRPARPPALFNVCFQRRLMRAGERESRARGRRPDKGPAFEPLAEQKKPTPGGQKILI